MLFAGSGHLLPAGVPPPFPGEPDFKPHPNGTGAALPSAEAAPCPGGVGRAGDISSQAGLEQASILPQAERRSELVLWTTPSPPARVPTAIFSFAHSVLQPDILKPRGGGMP